MGFLDPDDAKSKSADLSISAETLMSTKPDTIETHTKSAIFSDDDLAALQVVSFTEVDRKEEFEEYYYELRRHQLAHFSIEALIIQSPWKARFTPQELDGASQVLPASLVDKLAQPKDEGPKETLGGLGLDWASIAGQDSCKRIAKNIFHYSNLEPIGWVRTHLSDCAACRSQHPSLVEVYAEFDRRFFADYRLLATQIVQIFPTDKLFDRINEEWFFDAFDEAEADKESFFSAEDIREELIGLVLEPLAARFLTLAAFVGQQMSAFQRTFDHYRSILWIDVLKGQGPPAMIQYVQEWNETLRQGALIAMNVKRHWKDSEFGKQLCLPEAYEGELTAGAGLTVRGNKCFYEPTFWLKYDLVPGPPAGVWVWGMMVQAVDEANRQIAEMDSKPTSNDDDKGSLDPVLIKHFSDLSERFTSQSKAGAEQHLSELMGKTYGLLPTKVRHTLMGGEQSFRNPEYADPSQIVYAIAKAFEQCVGIELLPPLHDFLSRKGIKDFPNKREFPRHQQLRANGQATKKWTLGVVEKAFDRAPEAMRAFCEDRRLDFAKILSDLEFMREQRNQAAHQSASTPAEAAEARSEMLLNGGVFRSLLGPR